MAYEYPFYNAYQPMGWQPTPRMQYQIQPQTAPQPAPQPQNNSGLIWVQGEAGAKAYLTAPGQSVMLMNSEGSQFFVKSSDASGMPLPLRVFDYQERVEQPHNAPTVAQNTGVDYVTREEFNAFVARFERPARANETVKEEIKDGN